MFYETVGPGWSDKPSHYEDMSWSPSNRNFRSPGSSPESYRRTDFPSRRYKDDEFFGGHRSPLFPRRIFKEDSPSTNCRFSERPRIFKRVFKPSEWEKEFDKEDIPHLRRFEREFDKFDNNRPSSRKFDEEFDRHFNVRDSPKDLKDEFEKSEGKVHHIPIRVERTMEGMKTRFGGRNSPPSEEEYGEDWTGPQVQRLKKTFEPEDDFPKGFDSNLKSRVFPNTWDPHAVHTLPTRKLHKASQSMDAPSKSVFRSYSETHEDIPKPQQQHSAAFRSHSDGHCPKQTYKAACSTGDKQQPSAEQKNVKLDSPSLQQIAVVLQNVEDLVQRIEGYSGDGRDKQYRFLDEMLTRCMIRLDGIDTEGREDIRNARKAAVRDVQACIDRLEAKADESERQQAAKLVNDDRVLLPGDVAIPLSDSAIPLGEGPKRAIPLGDVPRPAIPLPDRSSTPIPLGDVPRPTVVQTEGKSYSRQNSSNEQTKL